MTEVSTVGVSTGGVTELADRAAHPLPPEVADGLDRLGLALADPTRRAILVHLLHGTQRPSELALAIGTSRSNLSNHLACLRGCGLITANRSGRHQHYELTSQQLADGLRSLLTVAAMLSPCDDTTTQHTTVATGTPGGGER